MENILYCYNEEHQIDPAIIQLNQGIISEVTDTESVTYPGKEVTILTPRDFIYVKDLDIPLSIGDEIYLDNQSHQVWEVCHGWYEVDENPAICGWYLKSVPAGKIRSLYLKDLQNLTIRTSSTTIKPPLEVKEV